MYQLCLEQQYTKKKKDVMPFNDLTFSVYSSAAALFFLYQPAQPYDVRQRSTEDKRLCLCDFVLCEAKRV